MSGGPPGPPPIILYLLEVDEKKARCLDKPMAYENFSAETLKQLSAVKTDMVAMSRCLCGEMLPTLQWIRKWHSGVINYTDLLCEDCRKEFVNRPRIVCIGCRSLMGFVSPSRDPRTGFKYESGKHYHIASCPRCNPKSNRTTVLEHERHCEEQHFKWREEEDIIQEVEQKRLQGERAAAKLRAEFNKSST